VWQDYRHIQDNASYPDGRTTEALLSQYGVQVIVMSSFDPQGLVYNLPVALADPKQTDWKLVYRDNKVVIFMRRPPPEVEPLNSLEALNSSEMQCELLDQHNGGLCARSLGEMYLKIGVRERAQWWLGRHLNKYPKDPVALRAFLRAGKGN
jgi:hypothetical protein